MKPEDIIGLYEKVRSPYSFLLQSGLKGLSGEAKRRPGRWSFIGYDPVFVFEYKDGSLKIRNMEKGKTRKLKCSNPDQVLEELQKLWKRCGKENERVGEALRLAGGCAPTTDFGNSPPFIGGLVGFFSYDFGVKFEEIKQSVRDDVGYPEVCFGVYDKVLAVDCEKGVVFKCQRSKVKGQINAKGQRSNQCQRSKVKGRRSNVSGGQVQSNITLLQYISNIKKIKNYLKSGDTYQVNFSQRFSTNTNLDPFEIYKKVTKINPSPFQAYFQGEDFAIVSNSPERLVRVKTHKDKKIIDTRPIKGTMPRGKTKAKDEKYRKILLDSKKDKAELTMIVDLARNDIGKICKMGTVEMNEDRITEGYSHVWHTMSNVRGIMRKDKDFVDVIKAVFPGGSITGCPKKRTMEIIDELEEFKRGVYTGSLGYISWNGDLDFNIMIRTMFCEKKAKNWRIYFHSGGGIVMDSDARLEYEETLDKAKALMSSLE